MVGLDSRRRGHRLAIKRCGLWAGKQSNGATVGRVIHLLLVSSLSQRRCEPLEALVQSVSRCGASRLNVLGQLSASNVGDVGAMTYPTTLFEAVKTQLVGDFCCVHSILFILVMVQQE